MDDSLPRLSFCPIMLLRYDSSVAVFFFHVDVAFISFHGVAASISTRCNVCQYAGASLLKICNGEREKETNWCSLREGEIINKWQELCQEEVEDKRSSLKQKWMSAPGKEN